MVSPMPFSIESSISIGFILLNKPTAKEVISSAIKALILNLLTRRRRIRIPIPTISSGMIAG
jgi:hypothetical protein